jgi:[acyl-carrier-protein] S-malonyltransferase
MLPTAFLFPGQGSQEVGMGQDLFKHSDHFRELIAIASDFTHEDLQTLCLRGPEKKLILARYLQPLLAAVSLGYHHELTRRGVKADVVMGHSLGEISALAAAGIVSDSESVIIAAKRGALMDEMASRCDGGMMAALFISCETVGELLEQLGKSGTIVLANDNASDQLVLAGDNAMLDAFAKLVAQGNHGKTRRLLVAGPWHSPYMREARLEFEEWAEDITFHPPHTPIILNALANCDNHPSTIKHLVTWQLTSPVFWRESMARLKELGAQRLYEIGPGRVLSGLARVNGFKKETTICNINNLRGVELAVGAPVDEVAA